MTTAQQLGSIIKSARQIMRKDKGLSGDLDRLPILTWVMFLKFLDDLEQLRETEAVLEGKAFQSAIEKPYRWRDWAAIEGGITGDELIAFINQEQSVLPDGSEGPGLFAYLRNLQGANGGDRRDVIATVFKGLQNRMLNGYLLRDVIEKINGIHFNSSEEMHTLSHLYETMLREMRDAAGDSGEFYTPRPVVRFMVEVTNPQLGETVLDPACGTGGFLVEAMSYLEKQCKTVEDRETLQNSSLYGGEAKPLPYLLVQMNLLLHGLEYPRIDPGNSLRFPLREIGDRERVDVVLTNPPFGGEEEKGIRGNFPEDMQASETAILFLQLIMRKLKRPGIGSEFGGRAAVVVPNTTLFYAGVSAKLRRVMVSEYGLCTVVRMAKGVFEPYTDIETNILFFDQKNADGRILYYGLNPPDGRKQYTKTQPLRFEEFTECLQLISERSDDSPNAWFESVESILATELVSLDLHNPKSAKRTIGDQNALLGNLDDSLSNVSKRLKKLLEVVGDIQKITQDRSSWDEIKLSDVLTRVKESVEIEDHEIYKRVTIKVKGRGIAVRDELSGSEIGTKRQFRIHAGQFALSKIDARHGAFGIVPEECNDAIITGNFWAYDIDHDQISANLLKMFTQSLDFLYFCIRSSPGATNRRYLQEEDFLNQTIAVPVDMQTQENLANLLQVLVTECNLLQKGLLYSSEIPNQIVESMLHRVFGNSDEGIEAILSEVLDE